VGGEGEAIRECCTRLAGSVGCIFLGKICRLSRDANLADLGEGGRRGKKRRRRDEIARRLAARARDEGSDHAPVVERSWEEMLVGGGEKEEGWQAAGLRFRNHGNGNDGHVQATIGRGSKVERVERDQSPPSWEGLTFKNVRNDGAPCETERGVPLVTTTKQMCGKVGRPSCMPCASVVEASGCEYAGGGTSWYLYLSTLPCPSRDGRRALCYIVNSGCRRLYQSGLRWAFPNFAISPTGWVGWPSPVLRRAIPPMAQMGIICQKAVNFIS